MVCLPRQRPPIRPVTSTVPQLQLQDTLHPRPQDAHSRATPDAHSLCVADALQSQAVLPNSAALTVAHSSTATSTATPNPATSSRGLHIRAFTRLTASSHPKHSLRRRTRSHAHVARRTRLHPSSSAVHISQSPLLEAPSPSQRHESATPPQLDHLDLNC